MNDPTAQAALDRAIDGEDRLLLVYQPIHDARTRAIWAAEALLRQRRESGEIREASIITGAAEESRGPELFVLDSMLVKRAYADAANWPDGVRLNVNLSPREFQEGNVLDRLTALMTSCGIDTRRVNLEQLDFLIDLGVESIQGFLFSRPMTAERFAELLRATR